MGLALVERGEGKVKNDSEIVANDAFGESNLGTYVRRGSFRAG